jgi:hypothetical protein
MPAWVWVLIAVVVVAVIAVVAWQAMARRRPAICQIGSARVRSHGRRPTRSATQSQSSRRGKSAAAARDPAAVAVTHERYSTGGRACRPSSSTTRAPRSQVRTADQSVMESGATRFALRTACRGRLRRIRTSSRTTGGPHSRQGERRRSTRPRISGRRCATSALFEDLVEPAADQPIDRAGRHRAHSAGDTTARR